MGKFKPVSAGSIKGSAIVQLQGFTKTVRGGANAAVITLLSASKPARVFSEEDVILTIDAFVTATGLHQASIDPATVVNKGKTLKILSVTQTAGVKTTLNVAIGHEIVGGDILLYNDGINWVVSVVISSTDTTIVIPETVDLDTTVPIKRVGLYVPGDQSLNTLHIQWLDTFRQEFANNDF